MTDGTYGNGCVDIKYPHTLPSMCVRSLQDIEKQVWNIFFANGVSEDLSIVRKEHTN